MKKKTRFFVVVENVEFGGFDYCCALRMIPNNYFDAIHSPDLKRWILAVRKEFESLVEIILLNGKRPPKIKILSVLGGFLL